MDPNKNSSTHWLRKNLSHAMKKEKYGILNSERFQQAMKNAELTPADFSYAHTKKFTVCLDLKIMKLTRCCGSMLWTSSGKVFLVSLFTIKKPRSGVKLTLREHLSSQCGSTKIKNQRLLISRLLKKMEMKVSLFIWIKKILLRKAKIWSSSCL